MAELPKAACGNFAWVLGGAPRSSRAGPQTLSKKRLQVRVLGILDLLLKALALGQEDFHAILALKVEMIEMGQAE